MISRKPWERRLEDLAHLLESCSKTYFEPDLFRRNTNQFLQTARTVTFIIQKNKSEIQGFSDWYDRNVLEGWKNDEIMRWAKDARNVIEKEGDLETSSSLTVTLIFSYLREEDLSIECGRSELLNAGIKKLVRFAQKKLPTGVAGAAGLRVERSWITASLPDHELLNALTYIYSRLYDCCISLAAKLGRNLPSSILAPSDVASVSELAKQIQLIKLKGLENYRFRMGHMRALKKSQLPAEILEKSESLKASLGNPVDFETTVTYFTNMARATFEQWGNHVEMVFLLKRDWSIETFITPILADQTDKFFFWRMMGERIEIQKSHCLVHTSEAWLRDFSKYRLGQSFGSLPIIGERLQTDVADRDGNLKSVCSEILRNAADAQAELSAPATLNLDRNQNYYLVPCLRGLGHEPNIRYSDNP